MAATDKSHFRDAGATSGATVDWRVWALWIVGFSIFSAILPRDVDYDVPHYQIHNGWAALHRRWGRDFAPADMHSFINPAYNILVWWLIERLPGPMVSAILSIPQALLLPGLFHLTRKGATAITGVWSGPICMCVAIVGFLAESQSGLYASLRNDSWNAAAFIWALVLCLRDDGTLHDLKRLAFASLIMGAALGMKATNLPYTIAFGVFVLFLARSNKQRLRATLVCAGVGFAAAAALALPYAWYLWIEFGNPVFPMANSLFDSPLGPTEYDAYVRRKPEGLIGHLVYPFLFTADGTLIGDAKHGDIRLLLGYAAATGLLALAARAYFVRQLLPAQRFIIALSAAFLIGLFSWIDAFSVLRYYLAGWMIGPALAYFLVLQAMGEKPLSRTVLIVGAGLGTVMLLTTISPMAWRRVAWTSPMAPYLSADIPKLEQYEDSFILFTGHFPTAFLATQLPPSAIFGHALQDPYFEPALANYRSLMWDAIAASTKPVYAVMFSAPGPEGILPRLEKEGKLAGSPEDCVRIKTNFDTPGTGWFICPVTRTAPVKVDKS